MRKPRHPISDDAKVIMNNYQQEKAKKYGMPHIEPTKSKWFKLYLNVMVGSMHAR
jgi:hypothetical protein